MHILRYYFVGQNNLQVMMSSSNRTNQNWADFWPYLLRFVSAKFPYSQIQHLDGRLHTHKSTENPSHNLPWCKYQELITLNFYEIYNLKKE